MDWSDIIEYAKVSKEALGLLKAAYGLLPKGEKREEIEAHVTRAEAILARADAKLAKELGFSLCHCEFPPRPMLWRERERTFVCQNPACGHRDAVPVWEEEEPIKGTYY